MPVPPVWARWPPSKWRATRNLTTSGLATLAGVGAAVSCAALWIEVHASLAIAQQFPSAGLIATPVLSSVDTMAGALSGAVAPAADEAAFARLARLADQVQPHFLFNTLANVLSLMERDSDLPQARRMLESFTDYLRATLAKLRSVRALIEQSGRNIRLEVDGGIKTDNIRRVADAGADTFVAGSAIFGQANYAAVITAMRAALSA